MDDDDALETIWKGQFSLEEFTKADQFKSYQDLERMNAVLNPTTTRKSLDPETFDEQEELTLKSRDQIKEEVSVVKEPVAVAADDNDDALSYFRNLQK